MEFSREQVLKVADLARLHLTDDEIEDMSRQLGSILEYFEKLGSIDTAGVEPLAHCVPLQNVFREDQKVAGLPPDESLRNAPKRIGDFFAVPAILE